LLWTPFFLIALFIAKIAHLPADGFSDIFQYSIGIAGLFYTWLGLRYLRKTLESFKYSKATQVISLVAIIFGTNLLYYCVCFPSQTHCYLFAIIAAFIFYSLTFFNNEEGNKKNALSGMIITLALISTIRPQDTIIILLFPFFGLTVSKFKIAFKQYFFSTTIIISVLIGGLVIARVCYYWYLQTGHVVLNPYKGRDFYHFGNPHFFDMLFSYRKGWITYSPLIFIGLIGVSFMKNYFQKIYLFIFWMILIYITSCWWCWTYSPTSFGQRVFVDYYALIAISLGAIFDFFIKRKWLIGTGLILMSAIPLSILQTHQYKIGIIPGDFATAETYWGNFFKINPVPQYPIPKSAIINQYAKLIDFEQSINDVKITDREVYSGKKATFISKTSPYSDGCQIAIPAFMKSGDYSHVRASAMVRSSPNFSKEILVLDFFAKGKSVSWNGFEMSNFIFNKEWTYFECGLTLPKGVASNDTLNFYFWQAEGNDTTYIDNMKLEFITIDHSYDLLK
jgi:hypothetical protein